MKHQTAVIVLTVLIVVFVLSILDAMNQPAFNVIPESIAAVASAILIGVSIALVLGGLRSRNGNGSDNERSDDD